MRSDTADPSESRTDLYCWRKRAQNGHSRSVNSTIRTFAVLSPTYCLRALTVRANSVQIAAALHEPRRYVCGVRISRTTATPERASAAATRSAVKTLSNVIVTGTSNPPSYVFRHKLHTPMKGAVRRQQCSSSTIWMKRGGRRRQKKRPTPPTSPTPPPIRSRQRNYTFLGQNRSSRRNPEMQLDATEDPQNVEQSVDVLVGQFSVG